MLGQIALVCGLPLALIAGGIQPFIDVVLGPEWLPTSDIVLYGSLSMMLVASVASPINSFFLAEGKPNVPVLAVSAEADPRVPPGRGSDWQASTRRGSASRCRLARAVSVFVLLVAAQPQVRSRCRSGCPRHRDNLLAAAAGQILPVSYDAAGLIAALFATGVRLAGAGCRSPPRRRLGQVLGMIRGLGPRGSAMTNPNPNRLHPDPQRRREPAALPCFTSTTDFRIHIVVADNGEGEGCSALLSEQFPEVTRIGFRSQPRLRQRPQSGDPRGGRGPDRPAQRRRRRRADDGREAGGGQRSGRAGRGSAAERTRHQSNRLGRRHRSTRP